MKRRWIPRCPERIGDMKVEAESGGIFWRLRRRKSRLLRYGKMDADDEEEVLRKPDGILWRTAATAAQKKNPQHLQTETDNPKCKKYNQFQIL